MIFVKDNKVFGLLGKVLIIISIIAYFAVVLHGLYELFNISARDAFLVILVVAGLMYMWFQNE